MDGLIRSMKPEGRLIIVDWAKVETKEGPEIRFKISYDKMKYLAELYNLEVTAIHNINEFIYCIEVKAGPEFQLLRENNLNETIMSTPAIADNYLFFKTVGHIIAVSKK